MNSWGGVKVKAPHPGIRGFKHLPFLTNMEYMTRKCGSCGTPAPNTKAKFCNDCGSTIVDVQEGHFPVCDNCGGTVTDTLAQFCDMCGAPVRPSCPSCGNKAITKESKFCTRCGTVFATAASHPSQQPIGRTAPSVVLNRKRVTLPVPEEPEPVAPVDEWDPWSDGGSEFDAQPLPAPQEEKRYAHLPLMADEPEQARRPRAPQISMPGKKYGHLPLIADELKGSKPSYHDAADTPEPSRKARPPDKKGVFGFLKK
jgi:hypothetical protein